jgi:formate hydrogenlyase subunit 3/multisubunit Na+/H+ antiporter MnhD subunit
LNKYQLIFGVVALISLLTSLLFARLFYEMYWQWRDLFDENGRYFNVAENVVYTSESKIYALPCLLFFIIGLALFKRLKQN